MITINHVALVCRDEEQSDRFYRDLLEMEKGSAKVIDAALVRDIFGLGRPLKIVNYVSPSARFEIFIDPSAGEKSPQVDHVCLDVPDREKFFEKCASFDVMVRRIEAGSRPVYFMEDYDGNLFEVKETVVP